MRSGQLQNNHTPQAMTDGDGLAEAQLLDDVRDIVGVGRDGYAPCGLSLSPCPRRSTDTTRCRRAKCSACGREERAIASPAVHEDKGGFANAAIIKPQRDAVALIVATPPLLLAPTAYLETGLMLIFAFHHYGRSLGLDAIMMRRASVRGAHSAEPSSRAQAEPESRRNRGQRQTRRRPVIDFLKTEPGYARRQPRWGQRSITMSLWGWLQQISALPSAGGSTGSGR